MITAVALLLSRRSANKPAFVLPYTPPCCCCCLHKTLTDISPCGWSMKINCDSSPSSSTETERSHESSSIHQKTEKCCLVKCVNSRQNKGCEITQGSLVGVEIFGRHELGRQGRLAHAGRSQHEDAERFWSRLKGTAVAAGLFCGDRRRTEQRGPSGRRRRLMIRVRRVVLRLLLLLLVRPVVVGRRRSGHILRTAQPTRIDITEYYEREKESGRRIC